MTSANNAPEAIDPRLAEARDSLLSEGERVVAQTEGDQGQAIVLTDSRVLILKAGIAATGQMDGRIVGDFPLAGITAVNVRKGPLGAVIQVVSSDRQPPPAGSPPDNVIVFTGPVHSKNCESIATAIESAIGKSLGRVEAHQEQPAEASAAATSEPPVVEETASEVVDQEKPAVEPVKKKPQGGREPRTLAEEMFADLIAAKKTPEPVVETPGIPQADPVISQAEESADYHFVEDQEPVDFGPNPNLPKPAKRGRGPLDRVLVLLGLLGLAVLVCIGVTRPLRSPAKPPSVEINVNALTKNVDTIRHQQSAAAQYEAAISQILKPCNAEVAALTAAIRSGSVDAARSAKCEEVVVECWEKLRDLEAPPGLAGAKQSMVSGVFEVQAAVTDLAASKRSSSVINTAQVLKSLEEGRNSIDKALSLIQRIRADLKQQLLQAQSRSDSK